MSAFEFVARPNKWTTYTEWVEADRAALLYKLYKAEKRIAELEKALLSPENAEPVIAKLLGLKDE